MNRSMKSRVDPKKLVVTVVTVASPQGGLQPEAGVAQQPVAVRCAAGAAAAGHHRQPAGAVAELPADGGQAAALAAGGQPRPRPPPAGGGGGPAGGPRHAGPDPGPCSRSRSPTLSFK